MTRQDQYEKICSIESDLLNMLAYPNIPTIRRLNDFQYDLIILFQLVCEENQCTETLKDNRFMLEFIPNNPEYEFLHKAKLNMEVVGLMITQALFWGATVTLLNIATYIKQFMVTSGYN